MYSYMSVPMITPDNFYQDFAREWVAAWNSHNLNVIMSHYADEIEFYSPLIVKLNINPEGRISDKQTLKEYFTKGLAAYPDLEFKLHHVLVGHGSVVLYYESVNNTMSAEFMQLNAEGKITAVRAHYSDK
jgi:predicted ester cyclase